MDDKGVLCKGTPWGVSPPSQGSLTVRATYLEGTTVKNRSLPRLYSSHCHVHAAHRRRDKRCHFQVDAFVALFVSMVRLQENSKSLTLKDSPRVALSAHKSAG